MIVTAMMIGCLAKIMSASCPARTLIPTAKTKDQPVRTEIRLL